MRSSDRQLWLRAAEVLLIIAIIVMVGWLEVNELPSWVVVLAIVIGVIALRVSHQRTNTVRLPACYGTADVLNPQARAENDCRSCELELECSKTHLNIKRG